MVIRPSKSSVRSSKSKLWFLYFSIVLQNISTENSELLKAIHADWKHEKTSLLLARKNWKENSEVIERIIFFAA